MRRREFIAGLGSATAWPAMARAQESERARRVGVLMEFDEDDAESKARLSAFHAGLAERGLTVGQSVKVDLRWAAGNAGRAQTLAKELVRLSPDVILANSTPATAAVGRETQTIPIVFANVPDPIGSGFTASLSRPGGNMTGFINFEASLGGKWVELLGEIAPNLRRVAILFNPETSPNGGSYYLPSFEAAARALKMYPMAAPVRSDAEIETVINSLGREPGAGLVVMPGGFTAFHRVLIRSLAARNHIPALYAGIYHVREGGLLSYGPDQVDIVRRSASYIDRILRGAKPSELPVQLPIKFEMAINVKTASALGLAVPQSILLRADEVIE
jgi:putative ABC transport system substrate-binding protein